MLKAIETLKIYQKPPSPLTVASGEIIFQEGDTGTQMYGIISGEVEMYIEDKLIETIKEGDIFGEGAIVHEDHKRTSTAIAKTKTILVFLEQKRFLFVVQETPLFALEVLRSYSDRFRHLKSVYRQFLD